MSLLDRIFSRETAGADVLRLAVCAILFNHGAYRLLTGEAPGLGSILKDEGIPAGLVLGYLVCLAETGGGAVAGTACDADPVSDLFHRHHALSASQRLLCRWPRLWWMVVRRSINHVPPGNRLGKQGSDVVLMAVVILTRLRAAQFSSPN
jgi:hypothetical protein